MARTVAHPGTLSSQIARAIVAFAASRGVAPEELLAIGRVDEAELADIDGRVPVSTMLALWDAAPRLAGEPNFGLLLGDATGAAGAPLLGKLFMAHATLGAGLARVQELLRVANDVNGLGSAVDGDRVRVFFTDIDPSLPLPRQAAEYGAAAFVSIARAAGGDDLSPVEVAFGHAAPGDVAAHARVFRAPVRFGAPRSELVYLAKDLERPSRAHDPMLVELLERQAQAALDRLPARVSFVSRVREALSVLLPGGRADLDAVAARLKLGGRTVQRYLKDEGTSFQEVLDDVRRTLAEAYLRDRDHSIAEVAILVGFSDQAAFHRAFVRWTGETPGARRKRR